MALSKKDNQALGNIFNLWNNLKDVDNIGLLHHMQPFLWFTENTASVLMLLNYLLCWGL